MHAGIHPWEDAPPGQTPHSTRLLQRTVGILLECILVPGNFLNDPIIISRNLALLDRFQLGSVTLSQCIAGYYRPHQ